MAQHHDFLIGFLTLPEPCLLTGGAYLLTQAGDYRMLMEGRCKDPAVSVLLLEAGGPGESWKIRAPGAHLGLFWYTEILFWEILYSASLSHVFIIYFLFPFLKGLRKP